MGRRRPRRELVVAMNGTRVGTLERRSSGGLRFAYAESWLDAETVPPISLSMPVSPSPYTGDAVEAWFDHLLPDSEDLRARMQRALGADSTRPFDLLARAGKDCVGALQLLEDREPPAARAVEATPLDDGEIARRLADHRARPLGMTREAEGFRISLAGAQEKTALLWWNGRWHEPHGATPTTHILKLPIGPVAHGIDLSDSVENEWLCLRLAGELGLAVPRAEIADFEDVRALVVERFDRRWSADGSWLIRLPQEDACQALGVPRALKYEADGGPGIASILELLLRSAEPAEDRRAFFRAVVVFWLLGAIDGHAKNFSLALLPGGRCRLTPVYDVLSAYPVVARGEIAPQEMKLAMAVEGKNRHYRWNEIVRRHWASTARRARFPEREARAVLDDCLARAPAAIDAVAAELPSGFPPSVSEPILAGLRAAVARP